MGELVKNEKAELVGVLHGKGGALAVPPPFGRDIFLFDTIVAGTTHVEGMAELEPSLLIGERLDFFREPHNLHDPKAIVIKTALGVKIGYVPQADNAIFARLMDAGKVLFAKIAAKELVGNWVKIDIKVYLQE